MSGTYNGGLHDFGSGNLSVSFARQTAILDQGRRNAVKAAQATGKAVVSADGQRLLALPPRPDPRDYVRGPGAPRVGSAPTSGPGVPGVGVAPTSGPGVPGVGGAPTSGPGGVGFGGAVTAGAGAQGVVMAGDGTWFQGPQLSVQLGKDQDGATPYKQFGIWIQPSPLFTDAKFFEDRAGDDGPGAWANNTFTTVADWGHTGLMLSRDYIATPIVNYLKGRDNAAAIGEWAAGDLPKLPSSVQGKGTFQNPPRPRASGGGGW